jgi:hypothetical protein
VLKEASGSPVYATWHNEVCANYAFTTEDSFYRLRTGGGVPLRGALFGPATLALP